MQSQYNLGKVYAMGKIMVAGAGGVENVVAEKWFDMASDKEMVKRQIDKLRIKRDITLWDEAAEGPAGGDVATDRSVCRWAVAIYGN